MATETKSIFQLIRENTGRAGSNPDLRRPNFDMVLGASEVLKECPSCVIGHVTNEAKCPDCNSTLVEVGEVVVLPENTNEAQFRMAVRKGKHVKVKVRKKHPIHKPLTAAQKMALAKARKHAFTAAAKISRKRSRSKEKESIAQAAAKTRHESVLRARRAVSEGTVNEANVFVVKWDDDDIEVFANKAEALEAYDGKADDLETIEDSGEVMDVSDASDLDDAEWSDAAKVVLDDYEEANESANRSRQTVRNQNESSKLSAEELVSVKKLLEERKASPGVMEAFRMRDYARVADFLDKTAVSA